jgi:hypothetical protein
MPDGLGPVLRGGLEKSDVERAIRILEVLTQRVESVLRWVKAPDSTPANRGNRPVLRFCGVVYRDRDISHPICGGEYRGRGGSGQYLDVGGRADHRVRASERVVRNLECYLQSVDTRLGVLRGVVVAWCTDHTLTCTNTAILHRILTETLLDLDGQACSCQDFRVVPWTEDVTTAAAAAHHGNEVTDATCVPTFCFGTWLRPAEVSEAVVFACAGGICKLDPRMWAILEGDRVSLAQSPTETASSPCTDARAVRQRTPPVSGGVQSCRRLMSDSTDDVRLRTPAALPVTGSAVCGVAAFLSPGVDADRGFSPSSGRSRRLRACASGNRSVCDSSVAGPTSVCTPDSGPVSGRSQRTPRSSGGPQKSRRRLLAGTDGRDAVTGHAVWGVAAVPSPGDGVRGCSPNSGRSRRLCVRAPGNGAVCDSSVAGPTSVCTPDSGPVAGRPQRTPCSSGGSQKSRRHLLAGTDGRDAQCNNSVRPRSSVVSDAVQLCERWSPPRMPPLRLCTRMPRPTGEARRQLLPCGGRAPGGLLCARSHPVLYE